MLPTLALISRVQLPLLLGLQAHFIVPGTETFPMRLSVIQLPFSFCDSPPTSYLVELEHLVHLDLLKITHLSFVPVTRFG